MAQPFKHCKESIQLTLKVILLKTIVFAISSWLSRHSTELNRYFFKDIFWKKILKLRENRKE